MIHTEHHSYQMRNILEAKTFLAVRAAKRAYQQIGNEADLSTYREALRREFELQHIKYRNLAPAWQSTGSSEGSEQFQQNFICFEAVIVWTGRGIEISEGDCEQLKHYLQNKKLPVGLIFNFAQQSLTIKRVLAQGNCETHN